MQHDDWEKRYKLATGYKACEVTAKDWEIHHETIKSLFLMLVDGRTRNLTEVRRIMAQEHNFFARYQRFN